MATKTSSKKTSSKKTSSKKTASVATDQYGRRANTQGHDIDSALLANGKREWTVEELAKKTKLPERRIRQHMVWMVNKEFAQKTDKGYKLVK